MFLSLALLPHDVEVRPLFSVPHITCTTNRAVKLCNSLALPRTGTGGRLRDVMATGRGAKPIAGISSYCVGNLRIPGYSLPWEEDWEYAPNLASPLEIEVSVSKIVSSALRMG